MRRLLKLVFLLLCVLPPPALVHAEQTIELETTRIKTNEELPQVLYIVPWKELESRPARPFKLQLHDLFGDLYQPQLPTTAPGVGASDKIRVQEPS